MDSEAEQQGYNEYQEGIINEGNGNDDCETLRKELAQRLERESILQETLKRKEQEADELKKRYNEMKQRFYKEYKENGSNKQEFQVDQCISEDLEARNKKIEEKVQKYNTIEKEIMLQKAEEHGQPPKHDNTEKLQAYQKYTKENPIVEGYIRSEFNKSQFDRIEALKQLAEHITLEIDKQTQIKNQLEGDKTQFEESIKKLRNEFRKLQDDNERLADEADRYRGY